ncbi:MULTISPECIES: C4-dicarboxylate TRAP transporter substrate-binding protein [Chelativorans]|uniref:TRAP dicarboxylate transporter-DctP subunit n=1 Tax=Chelativorans sp. (strain BNC1) TaxID=266779 RepID=Q11E98_CHESB|nr:MULTISPECIES: TRAP transporter substrate-binding protein [Chelativorans]
MKKSKLSSRVAFLAATALMALSTSSHAETFTLTFASGFPPVIPSTATIINTFLPGVNAELEAMGSEHRVEWNVAAAGSLAGLPAILDVTRDGIADVAELGAIFEPNRLPLTNVGYVTPFTTTDLRVATLAVDSMIKSMPALQEEWAQHGLVYLTGFAIDNYVLMSKEPIETVDALNGQKVGVAGINTNWLDGTGAVGVITSFGTAYNDLQTGVFTSTIVPFLGGASINLQEVAPYAMKVEFGSMFQGGLVVSQSRWDTLPEEVKTAMKKSADKFQQRYLEVMDTAVDAAEKKYVAGGGKIVEFPEAERVKWATKLEDLAANWAAPLEERGLAARDVLGSFMDYQRANNDKVLVNWDQVGFDQ